MKTTLSPYLNFAGNAREAMEFYKSILGGELVMQTFSESGQSKSPADKDRIMHVELRNGALSFMASDANSQGNPVKMGDNIHMSLMGSDEATLRKYFAGLSAGGTVQFPLAKQFWGDIYGQLTDKFGVHWMVNIGSEPQK